MNPLYIRLAITLSCIILSATRGVSQHNPILETFSVKEISGDVFLNWIITSGNTCNGIQIYRSSDGNQFDEIGEIAGVCGSTASSTPYSFLDLSPVKNKTNFYRLELGGYGSSEILSIEIIDIKIGGYQIRSNPVSTDAKIYFANDNKVKHMLTLYNLSGKPVTSLTTYDDFFDFDASKMLSGLYFFQISNANDVEKVQGSILVQH